MERYAQTVNLRVLRETKEARGDGSQRRPPLKWRPAVLALVVTVLPALTYRCGFDTGLQVSAEPEITISTRLAAVHSRNRLINRLVQE